MAKGLKKGQCNNLTGRPKGSATIMTQENKQVLSGIFSKTAQIIVDKYLDDPETLEKLPPRDLMDFFTKMLPYVIPRLDVEATNGNKVIAERIREITRMVVK